MERNRHIHRKGKIPKEKGIEGKGGMVEKGEREDVR